MSEYMKNLKSAFKKMKRDQTMAGNQLVFKEKEALVLTSAFLAIPLFGILVTFIIK
ncbi:hypothetical protein [Crassaminicella profunda]|uniref:hypothetical protein n=1 Tax=Crassaminicella profunda TaxID=1286698 RepID=UPI001CA7871B|nr:hypothetical protein [Crassaminicella profunda]QZY55349.1 hypothetical protein K7H06_20525 [Crassaminicella profunda]